MADKDIQGLEGLDDEAKEILKNDGIDGLLSYADNNLDLYKKTAVNIAVTGMSGSGKSSLINRIRGLTPKDRIVDGEENPLFAKVGVTETTSERVDYTFPDNEMIKIWDLPGAGTEKFPVATYAEEMKFQEYDAFVILTKDRFYEIDKKIATMIKNLAKPFFFGRTKTDSAMKEKAEDMEDDFCSSETEDQIREDCKKNLGDITQDVFLLAKVDSITVEAGEKEVKVDFPDNDRLKEKINNSIAGIHRTALVLAMRFSSQQMIELKRKELQARIPLVSIRYHAVTAFTTLAPPLARFRTAYLEAYANYLCPEEKFQKVQLQITDEELQSIADRFGKEEFYSRLEAVLSEDGKLFLKEETLTVVKDYHNDNARTLLGKAVGLAFNSTIASLFLLEALNANIEIALASLKVVSEMERERSGI